MGHEPYLDLQAIRQALQVEQSRLQGRIDRAEGRQSLGRNPDRGDLAQAYANREKRSAMLALERERLAKVEMALYRISNGTYGTCKLCGEMISEGRLEVLPTATKCIRCQAR